MDDREHSMLAFQLHGPDDIRIERVARPTHNHESALVKVAWTSICGTDLHAYETGPRQAPIILGHEFSGVIAATPAPDIYPLGTRVVVDPAYSCLQCEYCLSGQTSYCERMRICGFDSPGGLAEYVEVPLTNLLQLPPELDLPVASLIEPLSCAHHAVGRANIHSDTSVLIMGAGSLGLGIASVLKAYGVERILICEPNLLRRTIAQNIGIGAVVAPADPTARDTLQSYLGRAGAAVVFETSGRDAALHLALSAVKKGGQIIVVATYKQSWNLDAGIPFGKELRLIWSLGALRSDFKQVMNMLATGVLPHPSWTEQTHLSAVSAALFEQLGTGQVLKPLIQVDAHVSLL